MSYDRFRRILIDYIFVAAAVAAMVGIRAALEPLLGSTAPLILFLLPVASAAWFGGFWPGLVATVLSGAIGLTLFSVRNGQTPVPQSTTVYYLTRGVPFLLVGACISFFAATLERERKKATQQSRALHASEERQRQTFESAKDFAIITTDLAGMVTDWNAGAEVLFGYSRAAIIGRSSDTLWTPEDRAAGVPGGERGKACDGQGAEDRRWHLRADGTRFFANGTMRPIQDADGRVTGFVKICRDDTDRLRGDEERACLAEQRRLALDAARLGWWQVDPLTWYGTVDAGYSRIFGIPAGPIFTPDTIDLIHADDRERVKAAVGEALRPVDPLPFNTEYRVVCPDGPVRWVAATGQATFEGDAGTRRAVNFIGTVADITESKAAADALAASEASFRQLADSMPQIVFAATPEGDVDYFNHQWYAYTGQPEGIVGYESWRHVFPDGTLDDVATVWAAAAREGRTYERELQLRRHDGVFRWHLSRAAPVRDEGGRIVRWFGTNTDIHEQKRLREEAETARANAENASRMKDDFLATISHELRTPLSAIVGWSHLLGDGRPDASTLAEGLAVIHRNAQVQSQLIEDILDVSRITSGRLRLRTKRISLRDPLDAAMATVRTAADAKGVIVVIDVQHDARLTADPDRLQQVFWNLMANAIKFTDRGGRVTVTQRQAHSRSIVTVADTGRGIEPDFLPFVFDRFRQADMTTTRRHGGLGLGLAIVRHLVELHGGAVSVTSDGEGHGSTFRVELPIGAVAAAEDVAMSPTVPAVADDAGGLNGRRVLVLDDEPDARRVLQATLGRHGIDPVLVENVADAIGILTADPTFDAVISDIGLPGEDGYVFIRQLRALETARGQRRLPAAALTAYTRPSDRSAVLDAGFDAFLAKPIQPSELLATLKTLVGHPVS